MIALRKRAEVDSKNLIIFVPDAEVELQQSLSRYIVQIVFLLKCFVGPSSSIISFSSGLHKH